MTSHQQDSTDGGGTMRARAVAALLAATGLLLAGCAATGQTDAIEPAVMDEEVAVAGAPDMAAEGGMMAESREGGAGVPGSTPALTDRQIIRSGYLSMRVEDVRRSAAEVRGLATAAQGLIVSEEIGASGDSAYATIQAQVPAQGLDRFIEQVSDLGTVDTLNLSASDVTAQVVDLDARIDALRTSINRLTQLLAQASRIEDLLAIETQLAQRQAELDSLTAQRTYLADQVAMSTLTVSLAPLTEVPDVEAPGFLQGLKSGWATFVSVVMVGVTAVGFLLPWLLLLAIASIPIAIILVRHSRRQRRTQATAPPADGTGHVD
jgi:hypothetical protein